MADVTPEQRERQANAANRILNGWKRGVMRVKKGRLMRGRSVRALQIFLRDQGFDPGPLDGIFGKRTRAAVKAFQKAQGITVDGAVGRQTMGKIRGLIGPIQRPLPRLRPDKPTDIAATPEIARQAGESLIQPTEARPDNTAFLPRELPPKREVGTPIPEMNLDQSRAYIEQQRAGMPQTVDEAAIARDELAARLQAEGDAQIGRNRQLFDQHGPSMAPPVVPPETGSPPLATREQYIPGLPPTTAHTGMPSRRDALVSALMRAGTVIPHRARQAREIDPSQAALVQALIQRMGR